MEPTRSSGTGSGNSGTYSPEMAEPLRFDEVIHSLMLQPAFEPPPVRGSSFTALLGLAPNQAVELLHHPPPPGAAGLLPLGCFPTFPSNAALVDRAARFSVFAAEESAEISDSGDRPVKSQSQRAAAGSKRKEAEKSNSKVKGSAKKSKSAEESNGGDDKLPYVHLRARRGQATDSHSLAERARREKINARMKLLQELVPGCSKISGTALVLDEIINHVQSLQRYVEFLSMRLAAVNPMIDFSGLDNILNAECGRLHVAENGRGRVAVEQSPAWLDGLINGGKQQHHNHHHQQQLWLVHPNQQHQQQQTMWDGDGMQDSTGTTSVFGYDSSSPNSVPLVNQLKTQLISLPSHQLKTEL